MWMIQTTQPLMQLIQNGVSRGRARAAGSWSRAIACAVMALGLMGAARADALLLIDEPPCESQCFVLHNAGGDATGSELDSRDAGAVESYGVLVTLGSDALAFLDFDAPGARVQLTLEDDCCGHRDGRRGRHYRNHWDNPLMTIISGIAVGTIESGDEGSSAQRFEIYYRAKSFELASEHHGPLGGFGWIKPLDAPLGDVAIGEPIRLSNPLWSFEVGEVCVPEPSAASLLALAAATATVAEHARRRKARA